MKKTVMHVLRMGGYSGAENVAITLIKSIRDEYDCFYVSPDGPITDIVTSNGIEHYSLEKFGISNVKKAIRDIKPDIIHAHDFMASEVCTAVAGKIPIISHLHNNSPWLSKVGIKSLSFIPACIKSKAILTVSESVMNEYVFGKHFYSKTKIVGNPISVDSIREKASIAENKEPSDIAFLGRLSPQKKPLTFVEIIKDIQSVFPNIQVEMIGEGELRAEVEKRIAEYGLEKNITLRGFMSNPYGMLQSTKMLCMPSEWEGFGLAAVEALALGKPVVAANVGGLRDIVTDKSGELCNEKEEYVNMILSLLHDESTYKRYCQGATERAKEIDNVDSYKNKIINIYETCFD